MTTTNEECIQKCNELLRGELSAIETYEQALERIDEHPEATTLRRILTDHRRNAVALEKNVRGMGGEPATDSGMWGTFAKAVQGTAKIFGDSTAVTALKSGEKHGMEGYEKALESDEVKSECKTLIRTELLPRQVEHISTLERVEATL
ncbi:PA2169 family four-helix-bundle protein [bacterium]|nr:PA2169 family four-helix-bundle protein [bacterium]